MGEKQAGQQLCGSLEIKSGNITIMPVWKTKIKKKNPDKPLEK